MRFAILSTMAMVMLQARQSECFRQGNLNASGMVAAMIHVMRNALYVVMMRHVTGVLTLGNQLPGTSRGNQPPGTSHGKSSPRACTPLLRPKTTLIYPITQRTSSIAIAESMAH